MFYDKSFFTDADNDFLPNVYSGRIIIMHHLSYTSYTLILRTYPTHLSYSIYMNVDPSGLLSSRSSDPTPPETTAPPPSDYSTANTGHYSATNCDQSGPLVDDSDSNIEEVRTINGYLKQFPRLHNDVMSSQLLQCNVFTNGRL